MDSKETIIEHIKNGVGIANGTVLRYTEHPTYGEPLEFAAMYYDGYWYTTRQEASRVSHVFFVEHLQSKIIPSVDIATRWEVIK